MPSENLNPTQPAATQGRDRGLFCGCVRVTFDAGPWRKQTAAKILSSDRRR